MNKGLKLFTEVRSKVEFKRTSYVSPVLKKYSFLLPDPIKQQFPKRLAFKTFLDENFCYWD